MCGRYQLIIKNCFLAHSSSDLVASMVTLLLKRGKLHNLQISDVNLPVYSGKRHEVLLVYVTHSQVSTWFAHFRCTRWLVFLSIYVKILKAFNFCFILDVNN